ncbi:TraM recognition domain-containing protein [Nubsella zeaxanthinifaciens]|uniref:TraM recognition domain-containing protein n=1 Tax=Nubsella zeaxanthinifaciens TaxID=392412 RepID=UPI003D0572EF
MHNYQLDDTLIEFKKNSKPWTYRHAFEGVQIFGGIGSGKTSGSGAKIAMKYLEKGFGGLVLTVKHDEVENWLDYARRANRLDDIIVIEPNGKYKFNCLEYESTNSETNKSITDNIVDVLKTVINASKQKDSGKSEDAFWENAIDMLMYNLIDLCKLAYGSVNINFLYSIAETLPKANDEKPSSLEKTPPSAFENAYNLAHQNVKKKVFDWYKTVDVGKLHSLKEEEYEELYLNEVPESRLLKELHQYFFDSLKNLNERTRSLIDFSLIGFLFRLKRDPVFSTFYKEKSNVTPDDCLKGKIIIINFPVKVYHKVGRDCQIMFKYIWQRRMEKRNVKENNIPVFLFADEAQNFIHEHDADFQATARGSRIATVYLTQNIPNYYGSMGGNNGEFKVKSFIGTLGTKIFHANSDQDTNNYSSSIIGKAYYKKNSGGSSVGGEGNMSFSTNDSEELQDIYQPNEFVGLKNGGEINNQVVSAIIQIQGTPLFKNNEKSEFYDNYSLVNFKQLDQLN